jgi:hypothetical protein
VENLPQKDDLVEKSKKKLKKIKKIFKNLLKSIQK